MDDETILAAIGSTEETFSDGSTNEYQEGDLERFFGIDPDFTGELSTSEYLDGIRGVKLKGTQ